MSAPPLTSVITVSFNSGRQLASSVHSVLVSSSPVEVWVVDNGSRDGSLERLRASLDPAETRVNVLENGVNLGFARANNQGLARAKGSFVLFLNPDCRISRDAIARMQQALAARPEVAIAGPLILNPDGSEQPGCRRDRPLPGAAFVRAFGLARWARRIGLPDGALRDYVRVGDPLPPGPIEVGAISGAFMLVRREAIDAVGAMDEGYFLHCEDLDWCERFRRAGRGVLFVPDVQVVHDKGGSSHDRPLRVLWHMHRGMVRYYRKFLSRDYPRPLTVVVLAGIWLRFAALASLVLLRHAGALVLRPLKRRGSSR